MTTLIAMPRVFSSGGSRGRARSRGRGRGSGTSCRRKKRRAVKAGLEAGDSPLSALQELANKTFTGPDTSILRAAEGKPSRHMEQDVFYCFTLHFDTIASSPVIPFKNNLLQSCTE